MCAVVPGSTSSTAATGEQPTQRPAECATTSISARLWRAASRPNRPVAVCDTRSPAFACRCAVGRVPGYEASCYRRPDRPAGGVYRDRMGRGEALQGGPLTILVGELLLVLCSLCYLVWWAVTYRPTGRPPAFGGLFLAGAVLGGLGGVVLLAVGAVAMLPRASGPALVATVVGGAVVGVVLVLVTTRVAHRALTTELPLIVVWATAQLVAGVALRTAGVLTGLGATAWFLATVLATLVGLACYLVFYRLAPARAYWVGMVPLTVDGLVAAALVAVVTLARV